MQPRSSRKEKRYGCLLYTSKLPVNEELTLREITAPDGYEIAEDVTFTLKDTMEVQKVEMKDARTPEQK